MTTFCLRHPATTCPNFLSAIKHPVDPCRPILIRHVKNFVAFAVAWFRAHDCDKTRYDEGDFKGQAEGGKVQGLLKDVLDDAAKEEADAHKAEQDS